MANANMTAAVLGCFGYGQSADCVGCVSWRSLAPMVMRQPGQQSI